ncbi:hypothetical protein BH09BAC4_BH09BAC4_06290 [soil metagenome]
MVGLLSYSKINKPTSVFRATTCSETVRLLSILLLLWLVPSLLKAQVGAAPPELERTKRLAALCKLWGHVTYFHPYLPARTQAWDSAFAAVIPLVKTGQSRLEYERVVTQLVAVLHDPATQVMSRLTQPLPLRSGEKQPTQTLTPDSILVVRLHHYADLRDWQNLQAKVQAIGQQLTQIKAVLFDLRTERVQPDDRFYVHYFFEQLSGLFSITPLVSLRQQGRMHDGLVTETGYSTGGFSSATYSLLPDVIQPDPNLKRELPAVFLVNAQSVLPPVALALQQAAKAAVVAIGSFSDSPLIQTAEFELPDSIQVQMRLTELMASDGSTSVKASYTLPATTTDEAAFESAMNVLKKRAFTALPTPNVRRLPVAPPALIYPPEAYPTLGYRMLAAAKIWTVIHYFFAYKELMHENWDQLLLEYIPRIEASRDALSYNLTLAEWYTHIHDGHGFINGPVLDAYLGVAPSPLVVRMIEKKPVVTAFRHDSLAKALGIELGDEILAVNGEAASVRLARYHRYQSASTPDAADGYATRLFLSGPAKSLITVQLKGRMQQVKTVQLPRDPAFYQSGI